jgi:hypothetical protein
MKKWMPTTCAGRDVAIPNFMIGIDDVLLARMACGSSTTLSSRPKTEVFSSSFSITASMTIWRSARSPQSVLKRNASTMRSRSSSRAPSRSRARSAGRAQFSINKIGAGGVHQMQIECFEEAVARRRASPMSVPLTLPPPTAQPFSVGYLTTVPSGGEMRYHHSNWGHANGRLLLPWGLA